ncbi:MAG: HIT domain-containing protein [Pirellulales bacterium]
MSIERLWAPWRLGYLAGEAVSEQPLEPARWQLGAEHDCFLCRSAADYADQAAADRANLVVWRGSHSLVVLNRFPYANGHVLVSPLRHVAELIDLEPAEHLEMMMVLGRLTTVMRDLVNARGFNIGLNLGEVAGAGVPGHLHWHLVPRWAGDHNFMPTVAQARVIPQSLEALWEMLTTALREPINDANRK